MEEVEDGNEGEKEERKEGMEGEEWEEVEEEKWSRPSSFWRENIQNTKCLSSLLVFASFRFSSFVSQTYKRSCCAWFEGQ